MGNRFGRDLQIVKDRHHMLILGVGKTSQIINAGVTSCKFAGINRTTIMHWAHKEHVNFKAKKYKLNVIAFKL